MTGSKLVVAMAALFWSVASVRADDAPRWTDAQLASFSSLVVRGRVRSISVARDPRIDAPYTYIALEVLETLRGTVPDRRLVLKQLGGRLGARALDIAGQPTFAIDEEVILFVEVRPRDSTLTTTAQWQGKFTIVRNSDGTQVARRRDPLLPDKGVFGGDVRSLPRWLDEIRRMNQEIPAKDAKAVVLVPQEAEGATMVADGKNATAAGRWAEAAAGRGVVRVDMRSPGYIALPDRGEQALRHAAASWTALGVAPFGTGGLQPPGCFIAQDADGRVAVGPDGCGELDPAGGTVALSGAWLRYDATAPTSPDQIVGGGVITNTGPAIARLFTRADCFEQLLLHELGHTVGAVHSEDGAGWMQPFLTCDDRLGTRTSSGVSSEAQSHDTTVAAATVPPSITTSRIGSGSVAWITRNGRFVVFSDSGLMHVYDRSTGSTSTEGAGASPMLSDDGRFLAFMTRISDGLIEQVYVRDRQQGSTILASISNAGQPGDAASQLISISADGRLVSFVSESTNFVAGDPRRILSLFTRDWQLGVTARASLDAGGNAVDLPAPPSTPAAVSATGRYVAFSTLQYKTMLVRDLVTNVVTAETVPGNCPLIEYATLPSISDDGRWIVLSCFVTHLAPSVIITSVKDRQTGAVFFLPDTARARTISGDGRFLSYVAERQPSPLSVAAVWDRSTGQVFDLGASANGVASISEVAGNAVAYAVDGAVYVLATDQPPPAPTNLRATVTGSTVSLVWTPPAGSSVTSYLIEAGSTPGASNVATISTGSGVPTFVANGVAAGTYFVRTRAANSVGVGPASNEVTVVVNNACAPPSPPTNLTASVAGTTVALNWSPAQSATTYILNVGSTSGASDILVTDLASATPTLTATGVRAGTYFVRLRAMSSCGTSGPSNETVVTVQ